MRSPERPDVRSLEADAYEQGGYFTAEQARVLLAEIGERFPATGPLTSGQLAGVLTLAWQAGHDAGYNAAAAREMPVCDWCGQAVVPKSDSSVGMTLPMWAHQATGLYGCERPDGCYATVNGGGTPARTAYHRAGAALSAEMRGES